MADIDILRWAYQHENDPKDRRYRELRGWERTPAGASSEDMRRLVDECLVSIVLKTSTLTKYLLTDRGSKLVWATDMEREFTKTPATSILQAMDMVVGFDDLKEAIARAIESRRRVNFLLEGPPACAKSLLMEGVRSVVPRAYMAFGSRTSASGLSEALFMRQPDILLLDEGDKMHNDVYSVLLGLMESGEIIETKSKKTRGIKLETMVIAACNSSAKMPREFKSRFALHVHFPHYTRQEFIDVCKGFLSKAESCPPEIAALIGTEVYDREIGDVRKARGAWLLMTEPTEAEVHRVIRLMVKYGSDQPDRRKPGVRIISQAQRSLL